MSQTNGNGHHPKPKNVLGTELQSCSTDPMTGFFRDGCCNTGPTDHGRHTVCIVATDKFLEFSKAAGNDLSTPRPEFNFPGVQDGDKWCLCVDRWQEAFEAGMVLTGSEVKSLRDGHVQLKDSYISFKFI